MSVARSGLVPDANFTRGVTEPSLPLQGMTSTEDIGEKSARPQDEIVDLDLERLETALRSLQREATVARLRSPPPLKSEGMPSPARAPRHALRWLSVLIVAGSVAPLAYYFSADSLVSASTRVLPSQPETFQLKIRGAASGRAERAHRLARPRSRNVDRPFDLASASRCPKRRPRARCRDCRTAGAAADRRRGVPSRHARARARPGENRLADDPGRAIDVPRAISPPLESCSSALPRRAMPRQLLHWPPATIPRP